MKNQKVSMKNYRWKSENINKKLNEELKNIVIEFYKADKVLEKKQINSSNTSKVIEDSLI